MKSILFLLSSIFFAMHPAWGLNLVKEEKNWQLSANNHLTLEGTLPIFEGKIDQRGMTITADGQYAYGTSYIDPWKPRQGGFISWYRINPKDGALTFRGLKLIDVVPTGIVISPNNRYAYVVNALGYINRYEIDEDLYLTYIDQFRHDGDNEHWGITMSLDGHAIYTSSSTGQFHEGHIDYYKVNADGSLTFHSTMNTKAIENGVCIRPDGKFVYSASEYGYTNWYAVNTDGSLSYRGHVRSELAEARGVVNLGVGISPNGRYIFTVENEGSFTNFNLRLWEVNERDGSLIDQGFVTSTPSKLKAVVVSPNGKFIYASAVGAMYWFSDRA